MAAVLKICDILKYNYINSLPNSIKRRETYEVKTEIAYVSNDSCCIVRIRRGVNRGAARKNFYGREYEDIVSDCM